MKTLNCIFRKIIVVSVAVVFLLFSINVTAAKAQEVGPTGQDSMTQAAAPPSYYEDYAEYEANYEGPYIEEAGSETETAPIEYEAPEDELPANEPEHPEPEYTIAQLRQMLDAALKDLIAAIEALNDAPSEAEIDDLREAYLDAYEECGPAVKAYELAKFVKDVMYGYLMDADQAAAQKWNEVKELRKSLGNLEGAISEVTSALAAAETDEERQELETLLDDLYNAIPDLVSQLTDAEEAYANALQDQAVAEARCDAANREYMAKKKALREAVEKTEEARQKWQGAQSALDQALERIDEARKRYDAILDMLIGAGAE